MNSGEVFLLPQHQESRFRSEPSQLRQLPLQFRQPAQFVQQQPQQQDYQQFHQLQAQQQYRQKQNQQAFFNGGFSRTPNALFARQQVYGPPSAPSPTPEIDEPINATPEEIETDDNSGDEPVIAVANAASTNGQYYILGKDKTLQRVIYTTTQTDEDIVNNGFTAQLRYAPVEPIRDPIYAYDTQGQLVRIYRKK